jgi:hypothetical protein
MNGLVYYGKTPVASSVIWSEEKVVRPWALRPCEFASGVMAVCPPDKRGQGKPIFGATHPLRQRQAVQSWLCEVCRKPIKLKTKISLSNERNTMVDGVGIVPLVVEPLCCVKCAWLSCQHCPHLKARVADGTILVRQVFKVEFVAQQLNAEATMEFCGFEAPGVIGHIKLALTKYELRDLAWLEGMAS